MYSLADHLLTREVATWGSYGPKGVGPKRLINVCDLSDDHLNVILETQHHISEKMREVLIHEVGYRAMVGLEVPEYED